MKEVLDEMSETIKVAVSKAAEDAAKLLKQIPELPAKFRPLRDDAAAAGQ